MPDEDTAQEINFEGDQERFETHHQDERDHFVRAMEHHAGLGPDPGKYRGPGPTEPVEREDTSEALAAEYLRETGPPGPPPPQGPVPPPEQVQQPMPGGGKKQGKQKPPSGTTPTAIGAQTVKPPEPEGEF
jgi:hypothetical protein